MILILIVGSAEVFAEGNADNLTTSDAIDAKSILYDVDLGDSLTSSSEITITDDNYDDYFNKYTGNFKDSVDKDSINTIKIGNVSEKLFTFDKPVNVMPSSDDVQIKNGVIHLIAGSSGSNITNLVINNTKGEIYVEGLFVSKLHGIWFSNSSDNLIYNNTIRIPGAEGCYAMPMGYSSRNKILYNDVISTFTSCILMGKCDYNNISFNRLEILRLGPGVVANVIYMNPWGHADYSGPADCVGTYISNNYLKDPSFNSMMEFTINVMGTSDNTQIINNTIVNGFNGIIFDSGYYGNKRDSINVTIENNTVINCTNSISISAYNVLISNNNVIGSAMSSGISAGSGNHLKSNITICNNYIEYEDLTCGISIGSNGTVRDNIINILNYGIGISANGANATIINNIINVHADNGILISNSSVNILNNKISTFGKGVVIISEKRQDGTFEKFHNNSIIGNTILSDDYPVYIKGYVYDTVVMDNIIETNQSEAFYIEIERTIEDKNSGNFTENTVNGVIENTETLIIDDSNFYDYFDKNGYLTYSFKPYSKKILFFTFLSNKDIYLTDKIILTSNKMPNLLYNVSISLMGDADESIITDFNFYNFDKSSIVLDGINDVVVKNNDFTILSNNNFNIDVISVIGGCIGCNITNNNIFVNSKSHYTYAIIVSEPQSSIVKRFSKNFVISNNNILIRANGVAEGMYFDALIDSDIVNNNINIISDGSAYGISACNVFGNLYGLKISSNEIFANSRDMSYLIEIFKCNDCKVSDNYINGYCNGVYGIGVYNSDDISIKRNEINVCGLNLTDSHPADALGKGNSAIYITRYSNIKDISNNIIDCENTQIITNLNSNINMGHNSFVISDYNHNLYFNFENILLNDTIKENDTILFKNFTSSSVMNINIPLNICSYNGHLSDFKAALILSENASNSCISKLTFINATLYLNNMNNISVFNNSFISSNLFDIGGLKNNISYNEFYNLTSLNLVNSYSLMFNFNKVSVESEFMKIFNSNNTLIINNLFNTNNTAINSSGAFYNVISNNKFYIDSSFGYYANNTHFGNVVGNDILIEFENPTAIYYVGNSSNNVVRYNNIISYSKYGLDYAVAVDSNRSFGNVIAGNYLIASNGFKRGDNAVNANYDIVCNNTPVVIYVSVNGSDKGNGSLENPFSTISEAIENSLSGAIIHILPGMYNESNIVINKNITLTAENIEGNTYINALNNRLFNITHTGILTVNALKIFNGFSVEGGSLFNNLGTLLINNSLIYNSSSYYDNSNPTFENVKGQELSFDCSNLGIGGAILNHGNLVINSSTLYNNFAHKGGAIADFGKTTIKNSLIFNNRATHGGAIFTDSNKQLTIEDSVFLNNVALTTLDYCTIKRTETTNHENYRYKYSSNCEISPGHGGVIYAKNSMNIKNSLFENNTARSGGAIAYDSIVTDKYDGSWSRIDYSFPSYQQTKDPFESDYNLNLENSIFRHNEAKDTRYGNQSLLIMGVYDPSYAQNCHGGAIFGSLNEFNLFDCLFEYNTATDNGGALCVQAKNSIIRGCKFFNSTAGANGGALDILGNFKLSNTDISNNKAQSGGAMQYYSYSYYGHIQHNLDGINVTISNNKALEKGGALVVAGPITITHSNIYGNSAPEGSTISGPYSDVSGAKIDVRSNWWGSTRGPDASVWKQENIRFRAWANDKVNWGPVSISASDNDNENKGNGNNGKASNIVDISTGSSVHTGSTLTVDTASGIDSNGFNFNGNWPSGKDNGNPGGDYGNGDGVSPFNNSGNSKTDVSGNIVNPNSLSKSNSSSVNDLASVGMTANAADASASSQSSTSGGGSGDSGKVYEITKEVKKEILDKEDLSILNILFILLWIFLFIGFYRKYCNEENT